MKKHSASLMGEMLLEPGRLEELKNNPEKVIKETEKKAVEQAHPEYYRDRVFWIIALGVLGALAVIAAVGSIVLVCVNKSIPEVLVALGSAAVGGIVGLFSPSPVSETTGTD